MPLMIMSPNMPERDSPSRKRSHEEYAENVSDVHVKTESQLDIKMEPSEIGTSVPPHVALTSTLSSPAQSSPAALTDAGTSTPTAGPASPSTPSRQPLLPVVASTQNAPTTNQPVAMAPLKASLPTGQGPPTKKKKVLSTQEKVDRQVEKMIKEEHNKQKAAEKEEKKAKLEADRQAKAQAKEQRRLEQERKEREKKEEAERKAKAQPKIANFFAKKETATPKLVPSAAVDLTVTARSPSPAAVNTEYHKLAIPFFVHSHVTLAKSPFAVSEDIREAKTTVLTEYLAGKREPLSVKRFDPASSLQLVTAPTARGRSYPSVRDLMAEHQGGMSNPIDLIAQSLSLPTRRSLKGIPVKQFSFHEDVRPGYYGTITSVQSAERLKKLAKNPVAKDLPLNYDYDSEAEWVQGDEEEDEEGIDEMSDEEEEDDDAKSMDEFLDDSDEIRRGPLMTMGSMEPDTSGICFEDRKRRNPNPQMYKFRMEFLIPNLEHHHSIDPFASAYWPSDAKAASSTGSNPAAKPQTGNNAPNGTMPPPAAPKTSNGITSTDKADTVVDLIPAHQMDEFKAAIVEFKFLPKTALLPTLKKKFDRCTSAQIKATLDHVAEKPKKKGDWQLKESA